MKGILVLFCGLASCQMLVKADTDEELCVFPFEYKGVTYYTCTTVENGGDYWCAFTSTYQSDRWKDCTGATEAESSVYVMLGVRNRLIKHQKGTIISHRGYPQQNYSGNVNSTLTIRVDGVLSVTLNIFDFVLEKARPNGSCYDYLQLNKDVRYCQNHLSPGQKKTFISANGKFMLSFHTDSSKVNRGFRIEYSYFTIETSSCETEKLQNAYQYIQPAASLDNNVNAVSAECRIGSPTISDTLYCDSSSNTWNVVNTGVANSLCFNILGALAVHNPQDNSQKVTSNKQGYIISHTNFPDDYTANINSSLTITGLQPQQIVQVKFLVFDLYYNPRYPNCTYDFLQITGKINNGITLCSNPGSSLVLDRWYNLTVYSSSLTFRFKTNENPTVESGFYFQYEELQHVQATTTTHISSSTVRTESSTFTPTTVTMITQSAAEISNTVNLVPEITTARSSANATSTQSMPITMRTNTGVTESKIAAENPTNSDNQLQGQDNSVALGAGIGVSALIILIAIIIAVLVLMRRRREQFKSRPDEGDSGPTYGYRNESAENTLQIRMSALPVDSEAENYYIMSDTAGLNNNPASLQDGTGTGPGETDYDIAEQVNTDAVYHLADDPGTDNPQYTLAEEVTPNRTAGGAHAENEVTGYEDEYQLADSTAEDYANIETIYRAEDERTLEEDYSSVLVTTKTKKTKSYPGVTELVDNDLYGS